MRLFRQRRLVAMSGVGAAFTPTSISGLQLWLDASQITGLNDGDGVATWLDMSGHTNNATQGTSAQRPEYKTNQLNGLPGVRSDGTNDLMSGTIASISQPCTVVLLSRGVAPAVKSYQILVTPGSARCDILYRSGTSVRLFAGAESPFVAAAWTNANIVIGLFDGSSSSLYLNGASPASGNPSTGGYTSGNFKIFDYDGSYSFSEAAYIFEVMIYNRKLNGDEVSQLRSYLNGKWQVY